ncbi:MAG: glycosyltransferase family 4 protein [Candidatus Angelobacter sp. Gp1-AA117]|nr:MAG: glycosyltransferase family 4 protein [Candidatus Angelobacter sp. Gp1-AA117]
MRLVLVTSSLARGGAERVMSLLASFWAEQGKEVTILVLNRGDVTAYPLHPSVKLRNLGVNAEPAGNFLRKWFRNIRKVSALRKAIREIQPELAISFIDQVNVVTLLATRGLGIPVVVSERVDPTQYSIGGIWNTLRKLTYPYADALVCQTGASLSYFQQRMTVKGYVISNPVTLPPAGVVRAQQSSTHSCVAMGRLVWQKGFDLLIAAFARVAERHPEWVLKMIGSGPTKDQLEDQVRKLGLELRVVFTGELADPFPVLCAADLFVLSSHFEGFPNALCEAMACGVPAISFDCPSGPAEIIRDGMDGVLVPAGDVAALSAAMDRLMANDEERARLAARAPEVVSRFSKEKVLAQWEQLFDNVLSKVPQGETRTASANLRQ